MLVIRMQRTGRKGHAMFRLVVQDSRRTPSSGKIVAALGSYDPHAKVANIDKEKIAFYLEHGAQPSDRVARMLKKEGVKLPEWVKLEGDKERTVRNIEKRRSTRPEEPKAEEPEAPAEEAESADSGEPVADSQAEDTTAKSEELAADSEKAEEPAKEEAPTEEKAEEVPAAEEKADEKPAEAEEEKSDAK